MRTKGCASELILSWQRSRYAGLRRSPWIKVLRCRARHSCERAGGVPGRTPEVRSRVAGVSKEISSCGVAAQEGIARSPESNAQSYYVSEFEDVKEDRLWIGRSRTHGAGVEEDTERIEADVAKVRLRKIAHSSSLIPHPSYFSFHPFPLNVKYVWSCKPFSYSFRRRMPSLGLRRSDLMASSI